MFLGKIQPFLTLKHGEDQKSFYFEPKNYHFTKNIKKIKGVLHQIHIINVPQVGHIIS